MAKYVRREIRQRGFFGWVFLLLFYGFNLLMLVWLLSYWGQLSSTTVTSDAARIGKTIGGTIGSGFIVSFWGFGAVILGLFALLTRGSKTIVEDYSDAREFTADDLQLRRNIAASKREPTF